MFLLSFPLLFCIGRIVWRTDALVTLTTKNSMDSFRCGDSEVLVCLIDPYVNFMSWTKNTTAAQLASCSPLSCTTNPNFATEYSFTFNTSSGIFEMTIINVTLTDQGTLYSCDDGLNSSSVTSDVVVNEDFNATLADQQIDANTTEFRATIGCIKNTTAQNVKWVWWLQEVNDTTGAKHYLDRSGSKVNDDSACKADTDCWIDGFTEITIILNITEEETGKRYKVGINVTFGSDYSDSFEYDTKHEFVLNLPIQERGPSPPSCSCVIAIVIAYLVIWIVQMQMCFFGYSQCSFYLVHGLVRWFKRLQLLAHVPIFGFIPAIYIYSSLEKSKRRYINWYNVVASAPLLGIVVKVILALQKMKSKSERPDYKNIFTFVAMVMVSMVLEMFVIFLCTVWCISQWYYPFIIALFDLITRWVLFIILAVLYNANIVPKNCQDSNTNIEDVPSPLAFGIALWCTPIIGILLNVYWKNREHTGHRVAPVQTKNPGPNNRNMSKTKDITPRALPKIPKVRSSHMLQDITVIHRQTQLPPIKTYFDSSN